jgi:hypothetical protein
MTLIDTPQPAAPAPPAPAVNLAKRNFILQQGLCDSSADACSTQYSALLFQPRVIGVWIVVALIFQSWIAFTALGALIWWCAIFPRLNPFEAIYNAIFARPTGPRLTAAPAPRRFAQFIAGSFGLAIGASLALHCRTTAYVLEAFLVLAIAALLFGRFCLGSFIYHVIRGKAAFATRTLPWAAKG